MLWEIKFEITKFFGIVCWLFFVFFSRSSYPWEFGVWKNEEIKVFDKNKNLPGFDSLTSWKKFKNVDFMGWAISQCPYPWAKQTEKNVQKHKKTRFFQFLIKVEYFYTVGNLQVARYVIGWDKCCVPLREKKDFFRKSEKKHKKCIRFAQGYALSAQNKIFHLRKGAQLFRSGLELVNK